MYRIFENTKRCGDFNFDYAKSPYFIQYVLSEITSHCTDNDALFVYSERVQSVGGMCTHSVSGVHYVSNTIYGSSPNNIAVYNRRLVLRYVYKLARTVYSLTRTAY